MNVEWMIFLVYIKHGGKITWEAKRTLYFITISLTIFTTTTPTTEDFSDWKATEAPFEAKLIIRFSDETKNQTNTESNKKL